MLLVTTAVVVVSVVIVVSGSIFIISVLVCFCCLGVVYSLQESLIRRTREDINQRSRIIYF